MSKQRAARDYNEPGRIMRTTRWWFAPENVTAKSRKRWKFYLVGIGVIALAALIVSFLHPRATPAPVAATPAPVPGPALTPACPASDPVPVPPETLVLTTFDPLWVRDGQMSRPTSTTGGPFAGNPFPSCFARTPEGALYATASFATGIITATAAGDDKAFFEARASHTGNYTVLMADLPAIGAGTVSNAPQLKISGYRWNSYTPDTASLELQYTLLTGADAGKQIGVLYNLTWEANDWLQIVPGKTDDVTVDGTHTYIPWGAT